MGEFGRPRLIWDQEIRRFKSCHPDQFVGTVLSPASLPTIPCTGTSTEVRNPDAGRDPEPVTDTSGNLVLTPKGGVGVDLGGGMYVKPGGGIGFGGIPFG